MARVILVDIRPNQLPRATDCFETRIDSSSGATIEKVYRRKTSSVDEQLSANPGQVVYDSSGNRLGRIRSISDRGFEVSAHADGDTTLEHDPGQGFGEGYLMWRCANCSEMGQLQRIPKHAPTVAPVVNNSTRSSKTE